MLKNHRELITVAIFFIFLFLPVCVSGSVNVRIGGAYDYPDPPVLLYPVSEKVVLTGEDFLEFRWDIRDITDTRYYDFRLYKGYDTYQKNLILKEQIPNDTFSFKVESAVFENNQVYTWTLKRINLAGQKSDLVYNSFKVIKENAEKNKVQ